MKKITIAQFLDAFTKEWKCVQANNPPYTFCPYVDRSQWTRFMMGEEGIVSRIGERLRALDTAMQYRREIYTIDGLFVGGWDVFRSKLNYPSALHVLIEHEMGDNVEEEMWKLIFWRAPLKVIIFYDWAEEEKSLASHQDWLPTKLKTLSTMLKTANDFHKEADNTSYLFIIGVRRERLGIVKWAWASDHELQPMPLE